MLRIIHAPHPVLLKKARPVDRTDKKIRKFAQDMEETLVAQTDPPGVGLAAPQVGQDLAFFIVKTDSKDKTQVFINPKIVESKEAPNDPSESTEQNSQKSKKQAKQPLEGCLSVPRFWAPLKRPSQVLLEYQDLEGNTVTKRFTGLKAVIVQHEIDHLNGILFTQRALEQGAQIYEEREGKLKEITL